MRLRAYALFVSRAMLSASTASSTTLTTSTAGMNYPSSCPGPRCAAKRQL